MNRIEEKFSELKANNKKALITFVTAGDTTLEVTKKLVREMEIQGADIIELGIPYSDPIAEGPVIQAANERALKNPIKIKDVMDTVKEIRTEVKVPLVYLLYFNCIFQYGPEKFFSHCSKCGIDGVIIPDLPFEERGEIEDIADKYSVHIITLVSPTSKDRIERIARNAKGFLYCVSSLGVTGMRSEFNTDFDEFFSYIDRFTDIPKALGFGISTPEHVQKLRKYCDGLIVGSAIVRQVEKSTGEEEIIKNVGNLVRELRYALDD
ncbi:MAG: tryptophan synthase subunit alpha [Clostridia bacterium]|nr:tryptophan synthase subunit alpha [Clostridia bacterium]